ncbi:hypothetical protein ACG02S_25785 [Roseateles sp. DC23W]|uniref:Uncharacterized protein n=1 Tax=Pelomonas dachongensis TaxID=3299029 RepID=A0ABW7EWV8_9BURK
MKSPVIAWTTHQGERFGFDPAQIFCRPMDFEALAAYASETRTEWADRYGGTGCGSAGGSGRCTSYGALQTKGVGTTPLVSPTADIYHSSGCMSLTEAGLEAIYSQIYAAALPFGSVPTIAIALTGGKYTESFTPGEARPAMRSLIFRPFVARPAHFLRNVLNPEGRLPDIDRAGLSRDAARTQTALGLLPIAMRSAMALEHPHDEGAALVDAGLRDLARRMAWQCAASFAKRFPHGSLTCSNIALGGQYLDFGVSSYVSSYRRRARPPVWQDPWNESKYLARILHSLRLQLAKYRPDLGGTEVISVSDLQGVFYKQLAVRLEIEMAKMAGLTEDLAIQCPEPLRKALFNSMRLIWRRGADEAFVSYTGWNTGHSTTPPPRAAGRYNLNMILAKAGAENCSFSWESALRPLLEDDQLRALFIHDYEAVRRWARSCGVAQPCTVDKFFTTQAARKNAELPELDRGALVKALQQLEADGGKDVGQFIDQTVMRAQRAVSDLDPDIIASNGIEQLRVLDSIQ